MGDNWWFEIDGKAFTYRDPKKQRGAVAQFKYQLSVTDEAILDARELAAVNTILQVSRCAALKQAARARLQQHEHAVTLRDVQRTARRFYMRHQ